MGEPNQLLGPAIVAAVISGLVSAVVVGLNFQHERRRERLQRGGKVRDFQVALRAEIAAATLQGVMDAMRQDPSYTPALPRLSGNVVFDVVVRDIPILPESVIAAVVHYERLRRSLSQFVEDLRSDQTKRLPVERRLLAHTDYVATYNRLEALAESALQALDLSLGLNKTGAARARRGAAKDGASAQDSSS